METRLKKTLVLFLTFLKIGAFTFGGGYAMIPLIEKEVADKRKWIEKEDILDVIAISESTPGPIVINAATFIGYKTCGILGSIFATLGVVLPSFLIIFVISGVLRQFENVQAVKFAFNGVRIGVLVLIMNALVSMYKKCPKSLFAYIIMGASFLVAAFVNISVIYVIIGCALVGLIYSLIAEKRLKS